MNKDSQSLSSKITPKSASAKNDYFEINLPRINFKDTYINPYFIIVSLIVLSFLLGMMTNKILFLQDSQKNNLSAGKAENSANIPANANQAYPTVPPRVDVSAGHLPVLGDNNAKVTVIEFSDLQCPFCNQFIENTFPELNEKYIKTGKIKFAYRHYPLKSIHPNAQKAGEALECANEQNKFWDYHFLIFKNQANWSPLDTADALNAFIGYAGELGLDNIQFQNCLETDKYAGIIDKDIAEGNKASVDGTPAFFINGSRLTGAQPFSEFERIIKQELKT